MTRTWYYLSSLTTVFVAASLLPAPASAQSGGDETIEEIITTGTRSAKPRSAGDSPVPVDVINAEDFRSLGNTADLTDNIKAFVPSYTATPATGDGSAFVRPTSLRGTAPDQTLVLVNGKRRHRSALVQFFAPAAGNGAHGVDIGMIPGIAIKRVEVLRDGASSQYGSDAIAGVINFVTKDAAEGGLVTAQVGEYVDGEQSVRVAANAGFPIGDTGFVNASVDWVDNDALSRGIQRPDAQALIDGGNTAVGQDAVFGDVPLTQTWGRPQTEGVRFFLNSGFDISSTAQLYAQFGLAETDGRYRFFYRPPDHSTFTSQLAFGEGCPTCAPDDGDPNTPPDTASLREQGFVGLPGGFTPFLDGSQDDASIVIGVDGEFDSGMLYDFSFGWGKSELDYFLNNTANPNLGPGDLQTLPQMDFDVGGYAQEEINLNADFSLPVSDTLNLAFGVEAREETFTAIAGEPNSFFISGSSGFRGVEPKNAGDFKRDNVAIYADVEHDITDSLLLQYAARYENFSDFGGTLNGKLAARFRINESFAIRGAVSTGFHAPTPGQSNVSTIITTFDSSSGRQTEEGLFPVSNPDVIAAGGAPLKEEKSLNISAGFTADIGDWVSLTADVYQIEVDDRIYRTGDIPVPPDPTDPAAEARSISFYTNALDVKHQGLDIVATSDFDIGGASSLSLALAYAYNTIEVTGQRLINGIQPVNDGLVESIENNYPEHRWVLSGNFFLGERFNVLARLNYFGEHYDERGRIGGEPDANNPTFFVNKTRLIDATYYLDLELGFQLNDNWRFVLGGANVLDEFIETISDAPPEGCPTCAAEYANRISVGLQYPRRTVANYEGASYYLRGEFNW
jgi:iron complex outermembrane receptor protein